MGKLHIGSRLPKCKKKKLSLVTLSKEYIEKNFDAYLDFVAKLTEEDINNGATITFTLKGDIFFSEEDTQVTIPNEYLRIFFEDCVKDIYVEINSNSKCTQQ